MTEQLLLFGDYDDKLPQTKKVLSLFSGCGGMDLGMEGGFTCLKKSINLPKNAHWISEDMGRNVLLKNTDFITVFANDIRPDAKAAWVSFFKNRYENAENLYKLKSIVDLVKEHLAGNNIFPNDVDVVTGGFPCQDFSIAGKRKGFNSDKNHDGTVIEIDEPSEENRGKLYIWMKEVINITKPKVFIAENVKGLTNLGDVKKIIEHDFSSAGGDGYLVIPARVLRAADYGVPQSRERVIFFGFRKNALKARALKELSSETISPEYDPYPPKTHAYTTKIEKDLADIVTCRDALEDLLEPDSTDDIEQTKYSKAKYMGQHCQGQVEIKLDSISPTIRSEHHGNIEFRRLNKEHGGRYLDELNSGLQERRLTIRECARLQTFPDNYKFILKKTNTNSSVNATNAYKIIGNAVPCLLGYNIAQRLQTQWDKYFV